MKYTIEHLGPHELPLIGRADWNDCLNLNCFSDTPGQSFQTTKGRDGKVAESVFIAGLYVLASREMEAITEHLGKHNDTDHYAVLREKMEKTIESAGWDGDWFRRAYDNDSQPVGSKECDEGKIFIEPQGMCVMAGVGLENGKAQKALDSVRKHLAGEAWYRPAVPGLSPDITCTWERSLPTRPGTRRMAVYSATPIHGS